MVLTKELIDAAQNGDTAAIQEWFSTGTRDPDEIDMLLIDTASGESRFGSHMLQHHGHIETMRVILKHGANLDATDYMDSTSLQYTAANGNCALAVLLLDHGAQVDASDKDGMTPLMNAADRGNCEIIRLLLHRGAKFNARFFNGDTAEDFARCYDTRMEATALLADVRLAGGWRPYVRYPRFRLLMLRIVAEQGRAETQDTLLRRLFPAGPPPPEGTKRPREAYRAQKGGRLPRGIFMHIIDYWRSSRDYAGPTPDGA